MLETLDQVRWPYPELPQAIRRVSSSDETEQRRGLQFFWEVLLHQGTVGQNANLVVPFWLELACEPAFAHRSEVLRTVETAVGAHAHAPAIACSPHWETRPDRDEALPRHLNDLARAHEAGVVRLPLLRQLLHDADPAVRIPVAQALGQLVGAFAEADDAPSATTRPRSSTCSSMRRTVTTPACEPAERGTSSAG
jgi:hypothetical protein